MEEAMLNQACISFKNIPSWMTPASKKVEMGRR